MTKIYIPSHITKCKYTCTKCGKKFFFYNLTNFTKLTKRMWKEHICWECVFWEDIINSPPENMEIVGNQCYQVFPFVDKKERLVNEILGGKGKVRYLLRKNGECIRSNDIWWIGTIPLRFQSKLQPTGWWTTKRYFESLSRSRHQCYARACMDRYHCYRYKYQIEFDGEILNTPPKDWIIGGEHCPAFLPLREIKDYDEYVKPSDIIDTNIKL